MLTLQKFLLGFIILGVLVSVYEVDAATFLFQFGSMGTANSEFDFPEGVTTDSTHRIIVADSDNHRVQVFDSSGNFIGKFGSFGTNDGQFKTPIGIAVDSLDRIIVSDLGNARVQIFTPTGGFLSTFGTPGSANGQFMNPTGVTVDSQDRIIVADAGNQRIQIFDSTGNFVTVFGSSGTGNGQFTLPFGIEVDSTDRIIVNDIVNDRIQFFDSSGNFISAFGIEGTGDGEINFSHGISVDCQDRIYVADTGNNRIQIFDSLGNFVEKFGSSGSGDGQVSIPRGVEFNAPNSVVIADSGNHRIDVFSVAIGCVVPDGINDLSANAVSSTQVDLSWSTPADNGSPITGYKIDSKVNGVVSTIETSFGDASTTSYSDTTLAPGDSVKYRIAAINSVGVAPYSNVPPNVVTPIPVPDSVADLALTVISSNQVDLSWSIPADNGSPITGYVIKSKVNGVVSTIETSFGDSSTTSYSDTSLSAGDVVTYKIAAINAGGAAPFSNVPPNVTTSGGASVPDMVIDLTLTVISSNQVDLSWSIPPDNGSPIIGYKIDRNHQTLGVTTLETSFGDATTISYSDTTLSPGDAVTYRIAAINAIGQGPYSNIPTGVTTP